ncbi:hypothetical protein KSI86_02300 [Dickeya oryzae]|uniref:hypothetical protein n=1 Tax=Dickeya oryzae TaxID=1240404 RepID=UPI002097A155|nr:hypothetical protein [Dickeya oryzae]MCO7252988.1 hypothetical protein [Dickeya oryzae]
MLGIVTDMPVWVIILLVSSLLYCISFCFKKDVSIKLLIIIPGGFMIFSIISLLQQGNIIIAGLMWLAGCIIGGMAANQIFSPQIYHPGRKAGTITVPGTWSVIIIFLVYFPLRYYIGYRQAMAADHVLSMPLILLLAVSSGGAVGFFTLRACIIFWRYKKLAVKE